MSGMAKVAVAAGLVVVVLVVAAAIILVWRAPPQQEQPSGAELDWHFGINGFAIPERVAELEGISPSELPGYVESVHVPDFIELGAGSGRVHPGTFSSFAWNNVDPDNDGRNLDFSTQDIYIQLAQRYGISLLPS